MKIWQLIVIARKYLILRRRLRERSYFYNTFLVMLTILRLLREKWHTSLTSSSTCSPSPPSSCRSTSSSLSRPGRQWSRFFMFCRIMPPVPNISTLKSFACFKSLKYSNLQENVRCKPSATIVQLPLPNNTDIQQVRFSNIFVRNNFQHKTHWFQCYMVHLPVKEHLRYRMILMK